jgi:hypothetical protein
MYLISVIGIFIPVTVIDRFCFFNSSLHRKHLKKCLINAAWNSDHGTFEVLAAHYKTLVKYCDFEDCGMVLGSGCGTPRMTSYSQYIKEAYDLGKSLA